MDIRSVGCYSSSDAQAAQNTQIRPNATTPTFGPKTHQPSYDVPTGWTSAKVEQVGPKDGYARVELARTPNDGRAVAIRAHVLNDSAPLELRRALKEGDDVRVRVERDRLGVRVVALERATGPLGRK